MAWVGLSPRLCSWVSLHVYLQGPRSECGWERLILHQPLRAHSVPGVGMTLHVSPNLTPPQNRGLCSMLFNQPRHHNRPRFRRILMLSGLNWCSRRLFLDDGLITQHIYVLTGCHTRRHQDNLCEYCFLACFQQIKLTLPCFN